MGHIPPGIAGAGTVGVLLARKKPAVWSIAPDATVFEAIQLMADKNVGALPVIDNSRLVGIVSERDYARKVQRLVSIRRRMSAQGSAVPGFPA